MQIDKGSNRRNIKTTILNRGNKPYFWLLALSACLSSWVNASPLFEDEHVLDVELIGPVNQLIENRQERDELPFILRANGFDQQVMVRLRGKSRLRVCHFPPIRLNLAEGEDTQTVFAGQDKLKLVTHCRDGDRSEKNVLEEYAAYRIFGLLSEAAYRVRLLHITYSETDPRGNKITGRRYGFVIEPTAQLSKRTGGVPLSVPGLAVNRINRDQAALVYVFQYMIGNTDWSLVQGDLDDACCHNGDLIEIGREIYYVPYDFDLAGLVNASYAKPDPSLRLRNVRQRKYRGYCTDTDSLQKAIHIVNSVKAEVFDLAESIPGFTDDDRERTAEYLEQFFKKSENEEKLLRSYEKQCIG